MVFPAVPGRLGKGGQTMNTVPGNYLEHAVEWFLKLKPQDYERYPLRLDWEETDNSVWFRKFKDEIIPLALKAPRFLMPIGGKTVEFDSRHLALPLKLPYPCVVMEFEDVDTYRGLFKAILIAIERAVPRGTVVDLYRVDTVGRQTGSIKWRWSPFKLCLTQWVSQWAPHFVVPMRKYPTREGETVNVWAVDIRSEEVFSDKYFPNGYRNDGEQGVFTKTDEQLLALLSTLQCSNVTTANIPAPTALNKKRIAKGKLPFVEYKILTVAHSHHPDISLGGHHASPRQHLRRGHIRRIAKNRTVWVHQCLVGDPKKGTIVKDYRVNA